MQALISFELKAWKSRPLIYIFFLFLWGLAFITTAVPQIPIGNSTGNTMINAPVIISKSILIFTSVGMLMVAAIISSSLIKDHETGYSKIFYSLPITKASYFWAKYIAGNLILFIVFLSIPLGVLSASFMPWVQADQVNQFHFLDYLHPIMLWMVPNLFFLSALFYSMAAISRNTQLVYVSGIICYALYLISYFSVSRFTDFSVAAILDPFGILTEEYVSNLWSLDQQNTKLISFDGVVLINRLIYVSSGVVLIILGYFSFRFNDEARISGRGKKSLLQRPNYKEEVYDESTLSLGKDWQSSLQLLFARSFMEFKMTLANRFFLIILLATFLILLITNWSFYSNFGVPINKYTSAMIEAKEGPFPLFVLLVLVIYAGDLIHRDRKHKFDGLNDTLPIHNWIFLSSKILNLLYITLLMFSTIIVAGIIVQLGNGFYHIELGVYLIDNFLFSLPIYFFFAIIIFFLHVIAPNEYIGHALVLLFWLSRGALLSLGIESHILHFGRLPEHFYSDINGFFPFSTTTFWFFVHWFLASFLLMYFALNLWKRGEKTSFIKRLKSAHSPIKNKWIVVAFILWIMNVSYLTYQVHFYNDSLTETEIKTLRDKKREAYKKLYDVNQPIVERVVINSEHFPEKRAHNFNLKYLLLNNSETDIDSVIISLPPKNAYEFEFITSTIEMSILSVDEVHGLYVLALNNSLKPGEKRSLEMKMSYRIKGFDDLAFKHDLLPKQTYFSNEYFPEIGLKKNNYFTHYEIESKVPNGFKVRNSFSIVEEVKTKNENRILSFRGSSKSGFGWFVFKDLEEISFEESHFRGEVNFQPMFKESASHALKAIRAVKRYMDEKKLVYPGNKFTLIQQARGFENLINTHKGISGFEELFGWRMSEVNEKGFDFFTYFIAREMMRTYLREQNVTGEQTHSQFFVNAFSEYFAFDFLSEKVGRAPLQYLKIRHNRYLSLRPKLKESNLSEINASKNSLKGLFALVGISRHIGQNEFNNHYYSFIRNTENKNLLSGNEKMQLFQDLLTQNVNANNEVFIRNSLNNAMFYDNRIEGVVSEKVGDKYVNHIKLNLNLIEQKINNPLKEHYEIRLLKSNGKVLKSIYNSYSYGMNNIEVVTSEKPEIVEFDPFYTVMDLNRNNNSFTVY